MINYCMGNVGAMRRSFRAVSGDNVVSLDNDDVVADFLLDGKVYFVLGDIPCANMRVVEYLSYARALKSKLPLSSKESRRLLKQVGAHFGLNQKVGKLSRVDYRRLQLASKIDTATRCVYVNFSGIQYTARTKHLIKSLLRQWSKNLQVVVAFSDHRFIPAKANATVFLPDGTASGKVCQTSHHIATRTFRKALLLSNLTFKWLGKIRVIRTDN